MSTTFEPRWASAPGVTIAEALASRGMTAEDLADALSLSDPEARRLMSGELEIDEGLAFALTAIVGGSTTFWLERDHNFRESSRWLAADELAQSLPLRHMHAQGWIPATTSWKESAASSLEYFDVRSAEEWNQRYGSLLRNAHYRTSPAFDASGPALAAWLRQSAIVAEGRQLRNWSVAGLRSALPDLRRLSRFPDPEEFVPRMIEVCASFGVAVVLLPTPPDCAVSGAAFTTERGVRVVALSARHRADDHLFFTLFHELGHLALHSESLFVDEFDDGEASNVESEADQFASSALIPGGLTAFESGSTRPTMRQVVSFAGHECVAPGLVVGQLQYLGILRYNQLNSLKRRYRWDGSTLKSARRH